MGKIYKRTVWNATILWKETTILECEVEKAKQLKSNRSPGSDEIYPEVLKLMNEEKFDLFVYLFNKIYKTGKIPD